MVQDDWQPDQVPRRLLETELNSMRTENLTLHLDDTHESFTRMNPMKKKKKKKKRRTTRISFLGE